jgi:hypothetical protein
VKVRVRVRLRVTERVRVTVRVRVRVIGIVIVIVLVCRLWDPGPALTSFTQYAHVGFGSSPSQPFLVSDFRITAMAAHERERSQRLAQTSRRLHEAMPAADVQRAQMAAAASVAATAAASGSSNEQPGTSNKTYVAKAALKAVERQRAAYAKAAAVGSSSSEQHLARMQKQQQRRQQNWNIGRAAVASIVQSAQNMVQAGQRLVEVGAHEHLAGMELIAAGEALAATIQPPEMPPGPEWTLEADFEANTFADGATTNPTAPHCYCPCCP